MAKTALMLGITPRLKIGKHHLLNRRHIMINENIKKQEDSVTHPLAFIKSLIIQCILFYRLKQTKDIQSPQSRFLRARILSFYIDLIKRSMKAVGFKQHLLLGADDEYVYSEGIMLSTEGTRRYLKVIGQMPANGGVSMNNFLLSKGIHVKNMVDIGANFGEISLYFAKQDPETKILAIEASPDNFRVLKKNCSMQNFSTDNIRRICAAVYKEKGIVQIEKGASSENSTYKSQQGKETVAISADTLDSYMDQFGFTEVDFVKMDIEGAEPELIESFRDKQNIKAILTEVGAVRDHLDYIPLLEVLWKNRECYEAGTGKKILTFGDLKNMVLARAGESIDFWFLQTE